MNILSDFYDILIFVPQNDSGCEGISDGESTVGNSRHRIADFIVPAEFWKKFWVPGAKKFTKGWTTEFNNIFKSMNDKCVLKFNYHVLKYGNPRNIMFKSLVVSADCKMNNYNCYKYKFEINERIVEARDYVASVHIFGHYNHTANDIQRRQISGEYRKALAEKLENQHVSVLQGEMLAQTNPEVLESGNRNSAPSRMLLYKIASEHKKRFDLDENFHLFLCKLRNKFFEEPRLQGKFISGFIQGYSTYPAFSVTLFSENQILALIEEGKESEALFLDFDATGRAFAQPPDSDTRVFYYSLVIPGRDWRPPVAAMEFISCSHSVRGIHSCLEIFVECLKKYSPNYSTIIKWIETDFSKAMIQSVSKAFNNIDLSIYLNLTFSIIEIPDESIHLIYIHVCSSHVIKAAINRIKSFTDVEEERTMMRSAVSLLIHTTDIATAKMLFKKFVILFDSRMMSSNHSDLVTDLLHPELLDLIVAERNRDAHASNANSEMNSESHHNDLNDDFDAEEEILDYQFNNTKREQSKFYQEFFRVHVQATKGVKFNGSNPLYKPKFIEYLLNELLPYYPLWSGVMIKQFNLRRNSNAGSESWNKFIKHYLFDGEMRQKIPRAINKLESNVNNRLVQRKFDCRTSKQQENSRKRKSEMSMGNLESEESLTGRESAQRKRKKKSGQPINSRSSNFTQSDLDLLNELDLMGEYEESRDGACVTEFSKESDGNRVPGRLEEHVSSKNTIRDEDHQVRTSATRSGRVDSNVRDDINTTNFSVNGKRRRNESILASRKIKRVIELEEVDVISSTQPISDNAKNANTIEKDEDFDLYSEEWNRKGPSQIMRVGFDKFPKNLDAWNAKRDAILENPGETPSIAVTGSDENVCNASLQSTSIDAVQRMNNSTALVEEVIQSQDSGLTLLPKPWDYIDVPNYSENWPVESFYVSGLLINDTTLASLMPEQEIDDNIINAFMKICQSQNSTREPLCFDSHFLTSWMENGLKSGYVRWAKKVKAWSYGSWLITNGGRGHWSVILVVFLTKAIIHLDSMKNPLSCSTLRQICSFIQETFSQANLPQLTWEEWTVYNPPDVPSQILEGRVGVDCGIHFCAWTYMITTSNMFKFTQHDMPKARKWIFDCIVEKEHKPLEDAGIEVYPASQAKVQKKISKINLRGITRSEGIPMGSESTFKFCAMLRHLVS
ncbi:hypothetical protein QAD02_003031 [Eretmocerus hayati]|uniref:Uncharacterized protein n=1 Tax=Eretmocerus hayati TaxID=131215 RepID=A0ACC2NNG5_9HYME|nr:hypothetical protein QAD02_003031 [Eretmocerus hayati]